MRFDTPSLSNNESNLDELQIYSDFNNDQIVINGLLKLDTEVSIFDMQGRQILRTILSRGNSFNTLNTENFSPGVYLVKVSDSISSISKKVIVR